MQKKIKMEGLSCTHCADRVAEVLRNIEGIKEVKVDLAGQYAVVQIEENVSDVSLREAVEEAGYEVKEII